ncbi:histidine phosphatase family protein [Sphingomonas oleivorans]|uniref:Histidine phosphatase family protein n=1 Tax=Sphingomonas oleivorans TaxID=1735121 RepID=A0A2T5FUD0_9SPHN|nr:histidine phosphatase family protein [Sphingomonas oleivorans]PTQ07891.1 histidine phosphatase family protein [Sphingomonas oleivorans]
MSALIHLVRHAAHAEAGCVLTGRLGAAPLTGQGRAQARLLADALAGRGISAIHASPRQRTQETAAIIAERLGLAVETVPALDEIDFGAWSGRSFAVLEGDPAWHRWNEARSIALPPGGESMAAAVERAAAHMEQLGAAGRTGVLCVTHCDIIRGLIAYYLGLGLDNMLRFDIDPASVSRLVVGDRGGRILTLNEVIG